MSTVKQVIKETHPHNNAHWGADRRTQRATSIYICCADFIARASYISSAPLLFVPFHYSCTYAFTYQHFSSLSYALFQVLRSPSSMRRIYVSPPLAFCTTTCHYHFSSFFFSCSSSPLFSFCTHCHYLLVLSFGFLLHLIL